MTYTYRISARRPDENGDYPETLLGSFTPLQEGIEIGWGFDSREPDEIRKWTVIGLVRGKDPDPGTMTIREDLTIDQWQDVILRKDRPALELLGPDSKYSPQEMYSAIVAYRGGLASGYEALSLFDRIFGTELT